MLFGGKYLFEKRTPSSRKVQDFMCIQNTALAACCRWSIHGPCRTLEYNYIALMTFQLTFSLD